MSSGLPGNAGAHQVRGRVIAMAALSASRAALGARPRTRNDIRRERRAQGLCACGMPPEAGYLQCRRCRLANNESSRGHQAPREPSPNQVERPISGRYSTEALLAEREVRQRERERAQAARHRYC